MKLNIAQQEAVETIEGPLLVLAGAGSGKTRVVTCRIIKLLELGVPSSAILAVTFTNKAANEMKNRVKARTDKEVLICTFHSLGSRILREFIYLLDYPSRFSIYDEEDSLKLIKTCLEECDITGRDAEPKVYRQLISAAKNKLLGPDEIPSKGSNSEFYLPKVYRCYQDRLKEYHAVDYDDLLYLTVILFRQFPEVLKELQERWQFVLVDEYQDTNPVQYNMIKGIVGERHNICVVGDPDQSIYSWRGATISNIFNFESDFPGAKVVKLEKNYRSTTNILEAANALISHNYHRYEKKLFSDLGPGEKIKLFNAMNDRDEAKFVAKQVRHYHIHEGIPLNEMVVFYRTNFQSRSFEDYLYDQGIPYVIVGGISFYQRKEIKDIIAYLKLIQSDSDYISFARTINIPKRGIGASSVEKLRQAATYQGQSILGLCRMIVEDVKSCPGVKFSAKQKEKLREYLDLIAQLKEFAKEQPIHKIIDQAIVLSGYKEVLKEDSDSFDDRTGNLNELISKSLEWAKESSTPTLEAFLEEMTLKSSLDEASEQSDRLNLMTIHNGKGLEFKVVFIVGLEEDLFPHINSRDSAEQLEEERRLCYVGITRAEKYLYLSYAGTRFMWGTTRFQKPSRFIKEIPFQYLQHSGHLSSNNARFSSSQKYYLKGDDEFIDDI